MGIGRLMSMVLAGIRVGGIGWELNRRSQGGGPQKLDNVLSYKSDLI
jgi:sulfite exporter TauE/SafE